MRERILIACDRLLARVGFRDMTMDELAREAGVSKRSIYVHFADRADVGLSSIERVVDRAHAEVRAVLEREASATARLEGMLHARVWARLEQVRAYTQSLDALFEVVRPEYLQRRELWFTVEKGLLVEVLRAGVAAGEFDCDDPPAIAEALLLATNAFLPYSLSVHELGDLARIRKRLHVLIGVLVRGVTKP